MGIQGYTKYGDTWDTGIHEIWGYRNTVIRGYLGYRDTGIHGIPEILTSSTGPPDLHGIQRYRRYRDTWDTGIWGYMGYRDT